MTPVVVTSTRRLQEKGQYFIPELWNPPTPSTYHGLLLQVGPAERNDTVLPGAESEGQPLSWKQTSGQRGQVQVPVGCQCADLWIFGGKEKRHEERNTILVMSCHILDLLTVWLGN